MVLNFSKLSFSEELVGSQGEQFAFGQIIGKKGCFAVDLSQEKLQEIGFDADLAISKGGYKKGSQQFGENDEPSPIIYTQNPRFVVVRRKTVERDGRLDNVLLVALLTQDNQFIHEDVLRLTLKGKSMASGSYYDVVYRLGKDAPRVSWLKSVFDLVPRAKGLMQAHFVQDLTMETKKTSQGTMAARFTDFAPVDADDMFLGSVADDTVLIHPRIKELYDKYESWARSKDSEEEAPQVQQPAQSVEDYEEVPF